MDLRAALRAPRLDTDPDIQRLRALVAAKTDPKERARAQRTLDGRVAMWLRQHPRSREARAARQAAMGGR